MSIIVEKSRTETLAELTMRQANIRLIQRKVADLVQQNEKDINVIDEWMQMYHEGSTLIGNNLYEGRDIAAGRRTIKY